MQKLSLQQGDPVPRVVSSNPLCSNLLHLQSCLYLTVTYRLGRERGEEHRAGHGGIAVQNCTKGKTRKMLILEIVTTHLVFSKAYTTVKSLLLRMEC